MGAILTDRIVDYFGLTKGMPELQEVKEDVSESPRVKTFGFEALNYSDNGLIGYEIGINADIGWSYELPLYNQDEYLVFR